MAMVTDEGGTQSTGSDQLDPDDVAAALARQFPRPDELGSALSREQVIEALAALKVEMVTFDGTHERTHLLSRLMLQLEESHPGHAPDTNEYALISLLDECADYLLSHVALDTHLEAIILSLLPAALRRMLELGPVGASEGSSALSIIDLVATHCVGWSSDLGGNAGRVFAKIVEVSSAIDEADQERLHLELASFLKDHDRRIDMLEERLTGAETGRLRIERARQSAAQMINRHAAAKPLPLEVSGFLSGPWVDAVQFLALHLGADSEEWRGADELTGQLVWAMQPIDKDDQENLQRMYGLTDSLPAAVRALLAQLDYRDERMEPALDALSGAFVAVMARKEIEAAPFEPIPCEADVFGATTLVSGKLISQVEALTPGQWFQFEDDAGIVSRIKLILKLDDVRQLLFANYNGVRSMQQGFDHFAYFLSANIVRPIRADRGLIKTLRTRLDKIVQDYCEEQEALSAATSDEEREALAQKVAQRVEIAMARAAAKRRKALLRLREEKAQRERVARAQREAEEEANREKLRDAREQVFTLHPGMWFRYEEESGTECTCRLAVIMTAADRYIFTDGEGVKSGEYSADELARLLALEGWQSVEQDEQEDHLAAVVKRLRQDRRHAHGDAR